MYCKILPGYKDIKFKNINLADEITRSLSLNFNQGNPMRSIDEQDNILSEIKSKFGHTFGGYLEDRSLLWNGFEESKKMIHLGIDINNLKHGDEVTVPCDVKVVHVFKDSTPFNGWGLRLILEMEKSYMDCKFLLYGHLDPKFAPEEGQKFSTGDIVGKVGNSDNNGGWFIHLHVQLIKREMFMKYIDNLEKLDGYLLDSDIDMSERYSSDPTELIFNDKS